MWYVVQTVGGQENQVLSLIRKAVNPAVAQELFIPRCEIKKRIDGKWCIRAETLVSGYIFVMTDNPAGLKTALRSIPKFSRLLSNDNVYLPLNDSEVAFINAFIEPDRRVVGFSTGVIEDDEIVILNGPLMHHTALIKKIDRHKRLAYLEIEILGRKKIIKVGLEIVAKKR